MIPFVNNLPGGAARSPNCARIGKHAPPWTGGPRGYPGLFYCLFAAWRSLRADQVTTPKKKAKARTITVNCRRGARRVTSGPERPAKSREMRRWTAAGVALLQIGRAH